MHGPALTRPLVLVILGLHTATAAAQEATPEPLPEPPPVEPLAPVEPPAPLQPPAPPPIAPPPPPIAPPPPVAAPYGPAAPAWASVDKDAVFKEGATPHTPVSVLLHASVGADWLRRVPRLSLDAVSSEREVPAQQLPSAGPLAMWRAQVGLDVVVSRRWVVPGVGIAVGAAIGPSDRVATSADGSPVTMRPWTTGMVTLLGPGGGVRVTRRRWTFAMNARVVASYVWMRADVATGRTVNGETISTWVPAIRTDLEVCRRVGPLDHACLYVEARAHEATFFNGGSAGLRWEFGG